MKYDELYLTLDGRLEFEGRDCSKMPFMQSTGRIDREGVEVFEGDILDYYADGYRITCRRKVVEWKQYMHHTGFNIGECKNYAVVGNIYEQPELLKET